MLEITFAELQAWLALFLWPFARITAFVVAAPILGHSSVPNPVKAGLAFVLSVIAVSLMPPPPAVPIVSWAGMGLLVEQALIGLALGLCLHVAFAAVQAAGEFIGLQMGLGFASFFSPDTGANTAILARWFYIIALLFFLALDGHLLMTRLVAESFITLPIGVGGLGVEAIERVARFGGIVFASGLVLALPLVAPLLIINLSLGILNRAAPQFTVFSVGFPMSLTTGLVLLTLMMTGLGAYLEGLFLQTFQFARQIVGGA